MRKPFSKSELAAALARAVAPEPAQDVKVEPPPEGAGPRASGKRILVAEDSEFNVELVREILRRGGHELCIVGDGNDVLARLANEPFDLLLLDLHMPGLDGLEVIQHIRARELATGGHLPVIALTARSRAEDRERCLAAGMDEFLSKPLRSKALLEMIARMTEKAP